MTTKTVVTRQEIEEFVNALDTVAMKQLYRQIQTALTITQSDPLSDDFKLASRLDDVYRDWVKESLERLASIYE